MCTRQHVLSLALAGANKAVFKLLGLSWSAAKLPVAQLHSASLPDFFFGAAPAGLSAAECTPHKQCFATQRREPAKLGLDLPAMRLASFGYHARPWVWPRGLELGRRTGQVAFAAGGGSDVGCQGLHTQHANAGAPDIYGMPAAESYKRSACAASLTIPGPVHHVPGRGPGVGRDAGGPVHHSRQCHRAFLGEEFPVGP